MSKKIPVGAVIAQTYGFAFGNFINNLGATWIPQAILLATGYFVSPYYTAAMRKVQLVTPVVVTKSQGGAVLAEAMAQNVRTFMAVAPSFALLGIISLICTAAILVGVTREALGTRTGSSFLQNPAGSATWRLIGSLLLYVLLAIAVYIAFLVVIFGSALLPLALSKAAPALKLIGGLVAFVLILVALCAFIYVPVRAGFLITPSVVAEGRVTLGWPLTRGNFWRIVVVSIAILLPLIAIEVVFVSVIAGPQLWPPMHPGVTPDELAAWSQQLNARMYDYSDAMRRYWYVTYPVAAIVTTFVYGLFAGESAFSYRALTAEKDPTEAFA